MQIPFLYQGKVMLRAGRYIKSLWRNWLARSAVNRKGASSSLVGSDFFDFIEFNIRSFLWSFSNY